MDIEISIAPQELFKIKDFPITNTFLATFLMTFLLILIVFFINLTIKKKVPGKIQNIFEYLFDSLYNFAYSVVGDEKKLKKIYPIFVSLFIFILVANLIPFFTPGGAGISVKNGGESIPFFRAIMSDYGIVLALSLAVVLLVQIFSISYNGFFGYLNNFLNFTGIIKFFKYLFKGKFKITVLFQGLLDFGLGLMNIMSEIMNVISLSFRLFGNIFTGEILTIVALAIFPWILPLPFMFLSLLSSVIQAFVFSTLTLIFISMAINNKEEA